MRKKTIFIGMVLLGMLGCTNSLSVAMGSGTVVTVGKNKVTLDEFKQRLTNFASENGIKPGQMSKDMVMSNLDNLINTLLLLDEAKKDGITVTTDEVNDEYSQLRQGYTDEQFNKIFIEKLIDKKLWLKELKEQLTIKKLLAHHFSNVTVSQPEIESYYKKHKDTFSVPEMIQARQIELPSEVVAQQALNALQSGQSFSKTAQTYSIAPGAANGGDMGALSAGDLPKELAGILFTLPVGKISGIIKTQFGYQIFLVEKKIPAHNQSLNEAKNDIVTTLRNDKINDGFVQWLKVLREQENVSINYALLKRSGLL
jgi:parvulin-like peptidyl-prolyl isomerase